MNKKLIVSAVLSVLSSGGVFATPLVSDSFANNGPLIGQNPQIGGTWAITGTSVVNPITVTGGVVPMANTGQDVYVPLSSATTLANGQSLYISLVMNVTTAGSGDYFLSVDPTIADASTFVDRLELKSTTGGYLLGWLGAAGGGGTVAYGTGVLSLGTSYQIVLAYNYFSATTTSATGAIYVNPTDPTVGNNTAYGTFAWSGTTADSATIAEINLRQGTSGQAPVLTLDNLIGSESFGDVVATPEPSTMALAAFGGIGCLFALRRRM